MTQALRLPSHPTFRRGPGLGILQNGPILSKNECEGVFSLECLRQPQTATYEGWCHLRNAVRTVSATFTARVTVTRSLTSQGLYVCSVHRTLSLQRWFLDYQVSNPSSVIYWLCDCEDSI